MSRYLLCAMLIVGSVACGDNEIHAYRPDRGPFDSFTALIEGLQSSPGCACDVRHADLQRQVARELDARRDLIERCLSEARPIGAECVPFGNITLAQPQPFVKPSERKSEYSYGWDTVAQSLTQVLGADDLDEWGYLYGLTPSLAGDDRHRKHGLSMGLDERSLLTVRRLQKALDACIGDSTCIQPELDAATTHYLTYENQVYADYWQSLLKSPWRSGRLKALRQLSAQVDTDLAFYDFGVNDTVEVNGTTLIVPMQIGDFAGYETVLEDIIESAWRSSRLQVRLRWVTAQEVPGAYKFVGHPEVKSARDYVSHSRRTVNLHPCTERQAIAHEFGHVLGLPDHYYTLWDAHLCQYNVKLDHQDIMSDHMSGRVTSSEFNELRSHYEIGEGAR